MLAFIACLLIRVGSAKAMRLPAMLRTAFAGVAVVTGLSGVAAEESYPAEIVQQVGHTSLVRRWQYRRMDA
jgi:hypothetical protein